MTHLFITGTDTGVGKTFISCAILYALRGLHTPAAAATAADTPLAVGYKPVASGSEYLGKEWVSEDALRLQVASSPGFRLEEINPFGLRQPVAPHIAAADEGAELSIAALVAGYRRLAARARHVVVEGVGGFRVPLNEAGQDTADLAAALGLPVVLVVGMRLGCLNHAMLTAEAIAARGLPWAGWIANSPGEPMPRLQENIDTLRRLLPQPCLGVVHRRPDGDACAAAGVLDLEALQRPLPAPLKRASGARLA
jgi:dethiobiotin synthetase